MGNAFSKKKSKADAKLPGRVVDSAPAQLQGGGVPGPNDEVVRRTSADDAHAAPRAAATLSPPPGTLPPKADRRATPPVPQEVKLASPKPRHPDSAREPSRSKVDVSNDENIMERVIPIPEVGLPLLSVYNEPLVRGLYALMWGDREESMKAVQRHLNDREFLDSIDKQLIFDTTVTILASSLKDKVVPVYFSTLETIKVMFDGLVNHIPDTLVLNGVNKFVPLIIHRVGNLNARIHTASTQMLLFLAADRRVGLQAIGPFALAPLKKSRSQAALYVGRLDLVQQMLRQFSSTQGLSVGSVMTFAAAALDSPDDKLRKAAVKVVCEIYRLQRMAGGNLDHKYLVSLKPAVMTKLEAKFAEVDAGLRGGGSMQGSRLAPLGPIISRQNLPCSARAEADGLCISSSSGTAAPLRKEKSKPPRPEGLQHKKPRPADRDENIWGPAPNRRTVFDDDEEGLMNEILYA